MALHVLLTERSVTRAAERMHVTQPAMSGILARLRESFGDPLLIHSGRESQLTPLAQSMVEQLREIAVRVDAISGARASFVPRTSTKKFCIMASDHIARVLLREALMSTATEAPAVTFEIVPIYGGMGRDLDEGRIDLLIASSNYAVEGHPRADLFEDSYQILVCNQCSPFQRISFEQYKNALHVLFQNRSDIKPWFDQWFENEHGDSRTKSIVTNNHGLIPYFVSGSPRIATVQRSMAQDFCAKFDLRALDMPMEVPRVKFVLQWHRLREQDPAMAWVTQKVLSAAKRVEQQGV